MVASLEWALSRRVEDYKAGSVSLRPERAKASTARQKLSIMHRSQHQFVDYLTLAYHEARNVRHLIRAGHADHDVYKRLVSSLSEGRNEAWRQIQRLRDRAKEASNVHKAVRVYGDSLGLSLEGLVVLYENPNWRGSSRGGNEWLEITRKLTELRDAIDRRNEDAIRDLLVRIPEMCHNTGRVKDKLRALDNSLG